MLLAGVVIVGCGGIAVIDAEDGSGGEGGSPNGPGPGPGVGGNGPITSTNNVGVGGGSLCQQGCSLIDTCLEDPRDCVPECNDERLCPDTHNTLISCLIAEFSATYPCDLPDACIVELNNYTSCVGAGLFKGTCSEGKGICDCNVTDQNGDNYQTICVPSTNFTECKCSKNGESIGTCQTPNFNQCSPLDDCCATLFFVP